MTGMAEKRRALKLRVYVAGPIQKGDTIRNCANGTRVAEALFRVGLYPFNPFLGMLWHFVAPHKHEEYLDYDKVWLAACHALLRLPGESVGADEEVEFALAHNIPVFRSTEALLVWADEQVAAAEEARLNPVAEALPDGPLNDRDREMLARTLRDLKHPWACDRTHPMPMCSAPDCYQRVGDLPPFQDAT